MPIKVKETAGFVACEVKMEIENDYIKNRLSIGSEIHY